MESLLSNRTVLTTWGVMAVLGIVSWLSTRRLRMHPSAWQTALEGAVITIRDAVVSVTPKHGDRIMPFVGTVWLYLAVANLVGIIPGLNSPTADLSATAALATLVFASVHWFGIRVHGAQTYFRHYVEPSPILLPFHVVSEISRTLALAVRLFGNIFSLEMAAFLVLLVAGFLVPVPILMLHIIEALVQAYVFGILALMYIAGGVESLELRSQNKEGGGA